MSTKPTRQQERGCDHLAQALLLAYLLAAVVVVHIIGALRHHFFKRNDILRRMTWGMRA